MLADENRTQNNIAYFSSVFNLPNLPQRRATTTMRRSRAALLGAALSTQLTSGMASSMTSVLVRAASATLVARRITDVAHQEASEDADTATAGSGSDSGGSDMMKAIHYGAIVLLIVMSAISSGLTLGLMSLDKVSLDVIIRAGDRPGATKDEMRKAKAARRILPVRVDSNLLLTTLVLTTVAVNSLLSILMADLTSGLVGFIVSTILILICGEIIPQSLCSRHALSIGSALVPVVRVLRVMLYIFAKPVSFVLDKTVGEDVGTMFTKRAAEAGGHPCEAEDHAPRGRVYRARRHGLQAQGRQ